MKYEIHEVAIQLEALPLWNSTILFFRYKTSHTYISRV